MISDIKKEKYLSMNIDKTNNNFTTRCETGDVETLSYILSVPSIHYKITDRIYIEGMKRACLKEDFVLLKLLLKNRRFNEKELEETMSSLLIHAVQNKTPNIVHYLLTSKDLERNASIHCNDGSPVRLACLRCDLAMASYLLTSEDLSEHANIEDLYKDVPGKNKINIIHSLCRAKSMPTPKDSSPMLYFLIFKYQVHDVSENEKIMIEYPEIKKFIDKERLSKKLENELKEKLKYEQKIKI